ncbi:unnamed protein product [Coccothraustes coccothraustes]
MPAKRPRGQRRPRLAARRDGGRETSRAPPGAQDRAGRAERCPQSDTRAGRPGARRALPAAAAREDGQRDTGSRRPAGGCCAWPPLRSLECLSNAARLLHFAVVLGIKSVGLGFEV